MANPKKTIAYSLICAVLTTAITLMVAYSNYINNEYKIAIYIVAIVVFLIYELFTIIEKNVISKALFSLIILAAMLLMIFLILDYGGLWENVSSVDKLRAYISSTGKFSVIVFIIIQFLQVVLIPIPGTVTTLAGAILFGSFLGAVYSYIGIVIGSITAFLIGRIFGFKLVKWIVGEKELKKGLKMIEGKDKVMFTLIFLLPFFPDDLICFVAGITAMSFLSFLIIIMLTRIVTTAITCFTVDLVQYFLRENLTLGIIVISLGIILTALAMFLGIKYGKQIEDFFRKKLTKKAKDKQDSKDKTDEKN